MHGLLWTAIGPLCLTLVDAEPAVSAEQNVSISAGAEALRESHDYPWYDADADKVVSFDIRAPWQWNLGNGPKINIPGYIWTIGGWTLVAVVLVVAIYLVVTSIMESVRHPAVTPRAPPAEETRRLVEALPADVGRRKVVLLDEARRLYEAEDCGEAILYLFSHLLVQLDKHRLIHLAKGKTNRQYLHELRSQPGLRDIYRQAMIVFEDTFFGGRQISRDRFEAVWNRLEEFDALADASAVALAAAS